MNNDFDEEVSNPAPPAPVAAAPVHADPKLGGSYTRDAAGAIVNNDPADAAQPNQE